MERIAKKEKQTLPFKFWNIPKWNKIFRMQIKYANDLLKEYSEREVFDVLKSKKGQRIYSLGAKKTIIIPLIEELRNKPIQSCFAEKLEISKSEDWIKDNMEEDTIRKNVGKKDKNLWEKLG